MATQPSETCTCWGKACKELRNKAVSNDALAAAHLLALLWVWALRTPCDGG